MQQFTGPFSIWTLRQGYFPQQVHKCHCSFPGYHQCGMLFKVFTLQQFCSDEAQVNLQAKFWLCTSSALQAGLLLSSLDILSFTNVEGEPAVALQTHFVPLLLSTELRQQAQLFFPAPLLQYIPSFCLFSAFLLGWFFCWFFCLVGWFGFLFGFVLFLVFFCSLHATRSSYVFCFY